MNAKDALRSSMNLSSMVLKTYISDLDDADLMKRPADDCNHIAWQLGHLIASEVMLLDTVGASHSVELPEGFAEAHGKDQCTCDDASKFHSKQQYEELFDQLRAASAKALEEYPEADFDKQSPEGFNSIAPTMGDVFALIATHPMMHAGQFVVVRRQLGKPVLI